VTRTDVKDELLEYVRTRFLDGDPQNELDGRTPLLQWGILTSMNTTILLSHIHERFGVAVPPAKLTGTNFQNLDAISSLVAELAPAA
jgi:acyl carrier protein